jgi:hypothetical protein
MSRKRLLNKPAKGINQTSTNGLGVGRADAVLGLSLTGGLGLRESRAERRAREAIERKGGSPTKGTQRQ